MSLDDEIINFEHPLISALKVNAEVINSLTTMDCYEDLFPLIVDRVNAHSNFILESSKLISSSSRLNIKRVK